MPKKDVREPGDLFRDREKKQLADNQKAGEQQAALSEAYRKLYGHWKDIYIASWADNRLDSDEWADGIVAFVDALRVKGFADGIGTTIPITSAEWLVLLLLRAAVDGGRVSVLKQMDEIAKFDVSANDWMKEFDQDTLLNRILLSKQYAGLDGLHKADKARDDLLLLLFCDAERKRRFDDVLLGTFDAIIEDEAGTAGGDAGQVEWAETPGKGPVKIGRPVASVDVDGGGDKTGVGSSKAAGDAALFSPANLADKFGVPRNALSQRLKRWRRDNHDGWIENRERTPREPQFLYQLKAVQHIIDDLKSTG